MSEIMVRQPMYPIWNEVTLSNYPDGMPIVNVPKPDYSETFEMHLHPDTMLLRPKTLEQFVSAMFYCDAAAERGHEISHLIIPHVPGGRQDRLNPSGDYLFTLKSVARMINERGFEKVTVVDPHSMVTPALINRCRVITTADIVHTSHGSYFEGYDGVIAPDAGAAKRAFDVSQVLGVEFWQAEKHRDVKTGKLSGFYCPPLRGEKFLVVDDICDGGGTFLGLADELNSQSVDHDLFVTHGIFSQGTEKLLSSYGKVITTDTTTFYKHDADVLSIAEGL